jgi:DNA-binding transcriptional regulator YdaS (Cro superfamily)
LVGKPFFRCALREISLGKVPDYIAQRAAAAAAPTTINRETSVLVHMLNRAVAWEYLVENRVDFQKERRRENRLEQREPGGRVRFLEPDEIERLLI